MNWNGVLPALTTAFDQNHQLDLTFTSRHASWLVENGCNGVIALGSLGEAAAQTPAEKRALLAALVAAFAGKAPVVAAISALSTAEAVELARMAAGEGCSGLMILPPYVYLGDWRETRAHVAAILQATELTSILYNNPVAYGTDFLPTQIADLAAEFPQLAAVKESSTDVRRVTAIRALLGERIRCFVGVDDAIVEGIQVGATGWVAGLVNAFPRESVELFRLASEAKMEECFALYRWFLPLLRLDTVRKFIQLIKQVQQEVGIGAARVRAPRLELVGQELAEVQQIVAHAQQTRPPQAIASTPFIC